MLQKVRKMLLANQRRLRVGGLAVMLIGLGGLVYVDGLPIKTKPPTTATPDIAGREDRGNMNVQNQEDNNLRFRGDSAGAGELPDEAKLVDEMQHQIPNQLLQPEKQLQRNTAPRDGVMGGAGGGVQQLEGAAPQAQNPVQLQQPDHAEALKQPDNKVGLENPQLAAGGAPGGGNNNELHAPPDPNAGAGPKDNQLPRPNALDDMRADDNNHPIRKAIFKDTHLPLKVKDIRPPDHLDGVRLEQDGHLNRDYKKEIFLGEHEEIEQGTEEEQKNKLKEIFAKVDTSNDGFISDNELEAWIVQKVEEHFDEAVKENEHVFKALDTDEDGDITWREFHIQFLMAKGHDQKKAEQHMEDYETIPLEADDKEQLIRFKFRWAEADEDPQDNKLTMDEFRNFRHPEQSENMLLRMVQDILENLDKDHDSIVTEEEFAALPPGEVDEQWKESDRLWQDERRKEFKDVIDLNKDGVVNKDELKKYVDPKNPQHSKLESQNLIELADNNKDNKVSLSEMLENFELFLGSKVVNTGRSFHDEF